MLWLAFLWFIGGVLAFSGGLLALSIGVIKRNKKVFRGALSITAWGAVAIGAAYFVGGGVQRSFIEVNKRKTMEAITTTTVREEVKLSTPKGKSTTDERRADEIRFKARQYTALKYAPKFCDVRTNVTDPEFLRSMYSDAAEAEIFAEEAMKAEAEWLSVHYREEHKPQCVNSHLEFGPTGKLGPIIAQKEGLYGPKDSKLIFLAHGYVASKWAPKSCPGLVWSGYTPSVLPPSVYSDEQEALYLAEVERYEEEWRLATIHGGLPEVCKEVRREFLSGGQNASAP